jgi:hypothetical protein
MSANSESLLRRNEALCQLHRLERLQRSNKQYGTNLWHFWNQFYAIHLFCCDFSRGHNLWLCVPTVITKIKG